MPVTALTNTAVQALFKERYRDVVPALFESEMNVCNMIETKTDVEKIGKRGLIIAKKMKPGGQVRQFDPDGGDMGRGTGAQYDKATLTPIPLLVALEATRASQWNTGSTDIAIKNAIRDQLKDGTSEYKAQLDRYLMGAGDGVMATTAANSATAAVTMATGIGTRWLRQGHRYNVYDAALAGVKGTVTIDSIDAPNKIANLIAALGIGVNGDKYLPDGTSGATPAWFNGFRYNFSSAATGLWMGLNRATYPQLRAIEVVAGGPLVQIHIRAAKNRLILFRDRAFDKGRWMVVWNPAQQQAYEELGFGVNQYPKNQPSRTGLEHMYDPKQFSVDGMEPLTTANQTPTAIDITNFDNWYRVETVPFGLYTVDEVSTFPIYGASGGLSATDVTYLASITQYGVDDPGLGAYVSGLTVPAQYTEFT